MISGAARGTGRWSRGFLAAAVLVVLTGMVFFLTGCNTSLVRTPRLSDDWSKGLPLGMASLNNRVALVADETGGVYAVWVDLERDLHFARLDDRASIVVERTLDLDANRPQQPQLALDADGGLHLTWLDRPDGGMQLLYASLSTDGEVIQGATPLSMTALEAGLSTMVLDPLARTVEVFWSDTAAGRPGLFHTALDWSGAITVPEEVLVPEGLRPAAQIDRQGFVHLAWRTELEGEKAKFHYAVYDPQRRVLGPPAEIGEPLVQMSLLGGPTAAARFSGPWLGLDEDLVYLAWLMEVRERGALSAFTFYQSFPQPDLSRGAEAGTFDYSLPEVTDDVVHVRGANPTLTGDPQFLVGQPADQALAFYTEARGPRNLQMLQSAVAALRAGQVAGQEVVSATTGASLKPSVAVDGQGHLHLVWIDTAGFDRYRVTYASTAPQVQKVLNPVTVGEVLSQTLELGFGALTLIGFLPLYLMWALPAFLLLLVFFFVTQEVDLDQPRARAALWVAVAVHTAVMLWTAGGAVTRLSSGNLPATPWILAAVRWLVPLLIAGLAVLAMLVYIRLKEHAGIFGSFFVFVLVDAVLYTLLYLTPLLLLG
jgi:hypothetical protein